MRFKKKKKKVFSPCSMPIRGLSGQFLCYECVNVSKMGFFVLGDEPT